MIRINLLPTEEVERAAGQRQEIATVGLVVAVSVLALIVVHSVQAARTAATKHNLNQVREVLQAIVGPYAEVLKIQALQRSCRRSSTSSSRSRRAAAARSTCWPISRARRRTSSG
jgi:hypothetical protein